MIGVLLFIIIATISTTSMSQLYEDSQLAFSVPGAATGEAAALTQASTQSESHASFASVGIWAASRTEARVAYITFSHLIDFSRFEKYVFPALDTYLAGDVYHVVLRNEWKDKYFMELCTFNQTYMDYCKRVKPIFVDCPEAKAGESPCCKQEKGLLQLLDKQASLESPQYDWYAFHDDDVYLRKNRLEAFLTQFSPTSIMLITGSSAIMDRTLGQSSYSNVPDYKCDTTNHNYTYPWGQPVFYTHGALAYIRNGLQAGGLVKQCLEYNVTHDAGNAVFHWMYSIPEVRIRFFTYPTRHDPDTFGSHGVQHVIMKQYRRNHAKFGQQYMKTTPTMRELHDYYLGFGDGPIDVLWHNVTGFRQTPTFQQYGDPATWNGNQWHTMSIADCMGSASRV
jgi:hypothetical protein